jgi:hypothetical protein
MYVSVANAIFVSCCCLVKDEQKERRLRKRGKPTISVTDTKRDIHPKARSEGQRHAQAVVVMTYDVT